MNQMPVPCRPSQTPRRKHAVCLIRANMDHTEDVARCEDMVESTSAAIRCKLWGESLVGWSTRAGLSGKQIQSQ